MSGGRKSNDSSHHGSDVNSTNGATNVIGTSFNKAMILTKRVESLIRQKRFAEAYAIKAGMKRFFFKKKSLKRKIAQKNQLTLEQFDALMPKTKT